MYIKKIRIFLKFNLFNFRIFTAIMKETYFICKYIILLIYNNIIRITV